MQRLIILCLRTLCLRTHPQEYPRNYVAALSVAPHTLGDAPLQALNAVMALSFLQVSWQAAPNAPICARIVTGMSCTACSSLARAELMRLRLTA
jgi:hypothetical protein